MNHFAYYSVPQGILRLEQSGDALSLVRIVTEPVADWGTPTPLMDEAVRQLKEYFQGTRRSFDLPLLLQGTPFQTSVWHALSQIPYGTTTTYGALAQALGKPRAARAVGTACHHNPLWIVIPCHRVVGKDGSLTGYGGGLAWKTYLLELEQAK